jgi:hypothetical protein
MTSYFFERSLSQSDKFPIHLRRMLGTLEKRKVEEAHFGDSPSRTGHLPNYRVLPLAPVKRPHDWKSFYEGQVMANRVEHTYPDMIYVTPSMEAPPQVRSVGRGLGYTATIPPSEGGLNTKSREGTATFMGSTVGGSSSGKISERDILYKHKRQYAGEYPMLADRFNPEFTATERRVVKENEARVLRKKSEGGDGADDEPDKECRFRPRSLQQETPFHPQYAAGKPVSSTYAMVGQVSYLPKDTDKRLRSASFLSKKRAAGEDAMFPGDLPRPVAKPRRPKTHAYAVTTWSSFAAAAAPVAGQSATQRSFQVSGAGTSDGSPYAPPKQSTRPPVRISVHPTRY